MVLKLSIKTRKGDAGRHTLLRQFSSTSAVSSAPSTPPISPLCSPAPLSASTSRSESIPPTRRARTRIIPFASPTSTQKTSPPLASPSSQAPSPLASPSSHAGPTRRASLWARVKRRFTSRPTRTPPPETNADAPPAAQFFDVLHDEPETYTRAPALLCATTYLLASAGQLFLDALFATAHIAAHPTSPPRVRCVLRNAAATADRLARLCTVLLVLIYIAARLLLLPPAQLWAGNLFVVPAWAAPTLKVWPKHRPFRPKPGPVPITDFRGLGQYALDMWLQAARAAQPTIYGISHLLFAAAYTEYLDALAFSTLLNGMHLHKAYNYKPRLRRLALLLPGAPAYFARRARAANYAELRIAGPLDDASLAPVKHIRDADPLAERWERWVAAMLRALDDEDAREIPHGVLDAGETDDVETEEAPVWVF